MDVQRYDIELNSCTLAENEFKTDISLMSHMKQLILNSSTTQQSKYGNLSCSLCDTDNI